MKQKITLKMRTGPQEVLADVKGGLAVHKTHEGWALTHVRSGLRVPHRFGLRVLKRDVCAYREYLLANADWDVEVTPERLTVWLHVVRSCVEVYSQASIDRVTAMQTQK